MTRATNNLADILNEEEHVNTLKFDLSMPFIDPLMYALKENCPTT